MNLPSLKKGGKDLVHVMERGFVQLRNRAGAIIAGREFGLDDTKPVVEVRGWVKLVMRERGKLVPGSHREGHAPECVNEKTWLRNAVRYLKEDGQ